MNSRKLAGAGAAAVGAVTAVTALLLGSSAAVAAEQHGRPDSAYGISASGLVTVSPVPSVESRDGEPVSKKLVELGSVRRGLGAGVFSVDAQAGKAETSVAQLRLLGLLKADLVHTYCADADGGLDIVNGEVLGTKLPEHPLRDQVIDASPLVRVTLGDRTPHDDGALTVTGIELTLLPAGGDGARALTSAEKAALPDLAGLLGTAAPQAKTVGDVMKMVAAHVPGIDSGRGAQTVTVGSATCNREDGPKDEPAADGDDAVPAAPAPAIVHANLPVTG